jgi:CrcB protein
MKKYVLIASGGALGAVARIAVEHADVWNNGGTFPINTLLVNVSGSFVLALVLALSLEILQLDPAVRIGLSTGFLGAFTTFSTFCKESMALIDKGEYAAAAAYLFLSPALGLAAAFLGIVVAREVVKWKLPASGEAK